MARVGQAIESGSAVSYTPPDAPDFDAFAAAAVVATPSSKGEVAGRLEGASAITPTGAFSYMVPIRVPAGAGGLQPELSLTYNSRGEDGMLGVGWQLTGVSKIARCAKTLAVDEQAEKVMYDSSDRFCLDGAKLMLHSGAYGADRAEYRSERADYAKIVSYGSALGGPEYFKVWSKEGLVREYRSVQTFSQKHYELDGSAQPFVASSRDVNDAWQLVLTTDRSGNSITYQYSSHDYGDGSSAPDHRLSEIRWTSGKRSVSFEYERDGDRPQNTYRSGVRFTRSERLKRIYVRGPNPTVTTDVWRYELDYDRSPAALALDRHCLVRRAWRLPSQDNLRMGEHERNSRADIAPGTELSLGVDG